MYILFGYHVFSNTRTTFHEYDEKIDRFVTQFSIFGFKLFLHQSRGNKPLSKFGYMLGKLLMVPWPFICGYYATKLCYKLL